MESRKICEEEFKQKSAKDTKSGEFQKIGSPYKEHKNIIERAMLQTTNSYNIKVIQSK